MISPENINTSNIIQIELVIFTNVCIYTYMHTHIHIFRHKHTYVCVCVTAIDLNLTQDMHWKRSKEEYMERLGG